MNVDGYGIGISDSGGGGRCSSPFSLKSLSITCVGRRIENELPADNRRSHFHSSLLLELLPDRVKNNFWDEYDRTADPIRWWFARGRRTAAAAAANLFYWGPVWTGKRLDIERVMHDVCGDEWRRRAVYCMKGYFDPLRIERRHELVVLDDVRFREWHVNDFVELVEKRYLRGGEDTFLVEADTVFLSEIPPEEYFSKASGGWISENLFVVRKRDLPVAATTIDDDMCRMECARCDGRLVDDESCCVDVLPCSHVFHPTCLRDGFEIDDGECPGCDKFRFGRW